MQRNIRTRTPTRRSTLFTILCSIGALTAWHSANATGLFRFENRRENAGAFRLLPEYQSLSTTSNYDFEGTKTAVTDLTSYKKTGLDLTGVYGVNKEFSIFGRISMASVSFETTAFNGSGSGLTEQGLGANYRLWESGGGRPKSFDAQLSIDLPLYDNVTARSSLPRQPMLGDGTLDITVAGFGTFPLNQGLGTRLFLIGGLGYTIRNNSYSAALPYQLQIVGLPEKTGLLYRLGFHGFKSMTANTGASTDFSPQAQTVTAGVVDTQDAGGSLIADALNSSYMHLRATLGYQWGVGDQVFLTYLMPMSGTSTAELGGFLLGAQFRFPGSHSRAESSGRVSNGSKPKLTYDLVGRVKQANDRLNLIRIDKGDVDGIEKGNIIDVYQTNPDGTQGSFIARGVVTGVSPNDSIVNVRQYKKEVWVQAGFIVRRITPQKK